MYVCAPQVYITSGGQDQILFKERLSWNWIYGQLLATVWCLIKSRSSETAASVLKAKSSLQSLD